MGLISFLQEACTSKGGVWKVGPIGPVVVVVFLLVEMRLGCGTTCVELPSPKPIPFPSPTLLYLLLTLQPTNYCERERGSPSFGSPRMLNLPKVD